MAIAVDASSPIRFTGFLAASATMTSAAFTAPTDALLVFCVQVDSTSAQMPNGFGPAQDTGSLVWTQRVARLWSESTDGGCSAIYTARTTSSVSRTVSILNGLNPNAQTRFSGKVYVVTGVDVDGTPVDAVTASNESGSTTNNYTSPSITPAGDGLLFGSACDFNAGGGAAYEAPSDGSTQDTQTYAGQISVVDGYKSATSGVGVTMNFNGGGAAASQHKECRILVRALAVAGKYLLVRN